MKNSVENYEELAEFYIETSSLNTFVELRITNCHWILISKFEIASSKK